jgi:hypothetical protein
MSHRCVFHLNTLIELDGVRVVVSTVGNLRTDEKKGAQEVAIGRYYETMAFEAQWDSSNKCWDADAGSTIPIRGRTSVGYISADSDNAAQEMHEAAVSELLAWVILEATNVFIKTATGRLSRSEPNIQDIPTSCQVQPEEPK